MKLYAPRSPACIFILDKEVIEQKERDIEKKRSRATNMCVSHLFVMRSVYCFSKNFAVYVCAIE